MILLAYFFLAALPSTVSSSVVMVSIAKGNIPAAIFNASISSLIGVVVTPLWVGLFIASATGNFDITHIILTLDRNLLYEHLSCKILFLAYLGTINLSVSKRIAPGSMSGSLIGAVSHRSFVLNRFRQ